MFQKSLIALAITCAALTAKAEKPIVLLFQDAKGISSNVRFLSEESLKFHLNPISQEIQEFLLTNRIALSENIENLNLRFVKNTQEFCAVQGEDSKSVVLSIPTCNKKYKYDSDGISSMFIFEALEKARIDLIRISVQNLGISDRKQADEIAKAVNRATQPQLPAIKYPVTTTIYTTKATAWCSFGNGSGNSGPWYGNSTSYVKEESYSQAASVAVAKCKASPAEQAHCRCEVDYASTTAEPN